jgi:hypothetical protein
MRTHTHEHAHIQIFDDVFRICTWHENVYMRNCPTDGISQSEGQTTAEVFLSRATVLVEDEDCCRAVVVLHGMSG